MPMVTMRLSICRVLAPNAAPTVCQRRCAARACDPGRAPCFSARPWEMGGSVREGAARAVRCPTRPYALVGAGESLVNVALHEGRLATHGAAQQHHLEIYFAGHAAEVLVRRSESSAVGPSRGRRPGVAKNSGNLTRTHAPPPPKKKAGGRVEQQLMAQVAFSACLCRACRSNAAPLAPLAPAPVRGVVCAERRVDRMAARRSREAQW